MRRARIIIVITACCAAFAGLLGSCEPEVLVYQNDPSCKTDEDCPDGVCIRSECVPGECTKDADCVPLPPTCGDSSTMLLRPIGSCDDEYHCIYEPVEEHCEFGCDFATGICKSEPCEGVVCQTPPNECFTASGSCVAGACEYPLRNGVDCDDGNACTSADSCDEGVCRGAVQACDLPPDDYCESTQTLRRHQPTGVCDPATGLCSYDGASMSCFFGCEAGACNGDPCGAGTCNDPPADYCVDADHARVYQTLGSCTDGSCSYQDAVVFCAHGCDVGGCLPDPCAGVTCDSPPDPVCTGAYSRRAHAQFGVCNNGSCQYLSGQYNCPYGCENGICRDDPCLGTSCNDNNPCTTDVCDPSTGACHHSATNNGSACAAGSSKCPQGTCAGGTCLSTANVTCVTEIDVDICHDVEVAGLCTASGDCVVSSAPPEYYCPDCNGLCIQCYILQICVPFF